MQNSNFKKDKGFTLIELIVAIAVFLFIIGAAIGVFVSIVQNQKRVLSETQFLNQISYIEEYMSKALRMAKTASTPQDIDCLGAEGFSYLLTHPDDSGFYRGIKFINPSDNYVCQEFFLDADNILKEIKNGGLPVDLTPVSLEFNPANPIRFSIDGSDGSVGESDCAGHPNQCLLPNKSSVQPRITMLLNIKVAGDTRGPYKTVQTTVSRRNLNIAQ